MDQSHRHFKDKEAIDHVVEAQARGIVDSAEIHGTEMPGHLYAASDAAKEAALLTALLSCTLNATDATWNLQIIIMAAFAAALAAWKCGRSSWLGWARLERLHRIVAQEKWEIDHHREQERDELKALYRAKGFDGKLLEDVMDVLMADGDRLLKVMVEEELGLSLGNQEHPLKQAFYALIGTLIATAVVIAAFWGFGVLGMGCGTLAIVALASGFSSHYEGNNIIQAVVWNIGLAVMTYATLYFTIQFFV